MSDATTRKVIRGDVNAPPEARLPGLVGGVVVGGPLQSHLGAGPLLEGEERVLRGDELAETVGEIRTRSEAGENLRAGPAEGAVARDERPKGRRHVRPT